MSVLESLLVAAAAAGASTYVAVQVLSWRVRALERRTADLEQTVTGDEGLTVRVAVLERHGSNV